MRIELIASSILLASVAACADEQANTEIPASAAAKASVVQQIQPTETPQKLVVAAPLIVAAADTGAAPATSAGKPNKTHTIVTQVTKFSPMVVFVQPGDTVTWTNMAGHDTASIEGMLPDGATGWQSKMGETYSHTFEVPGAYLYKCNPHVSMGMIGAIVVGDHNPVNLASIQEHPENKGMIGRAVRMMVKELGK